MKILIISLLLLFTLNAQDGVTRFFIDRDATGSGNGTSWANAWTNFNYINWASLSAGDTIYVSGGSDSTAYRPYNNNSGSNISIVGNSPYYSFASGNPVVICPSWETGHNGGVYLTHHPLNQVESGTATSTEDFYLNETGQNFTSTVSVNDRIYNITKSVTLAVDTVVSNTRLRTNSTRMEAGDEYIIYHGVPQRLINFYGVSNVKLYGFTIVDDREVFAGGSSIYIGGGEVAAEGIDSMQIIENCHYISKGNNYGLYIIGTKVTIKDCILENLENYNEDPQDMFGVSGGRGGNTFDGNTLIFRNRSNTTEEHADGIQFSNFGIGESVGGVYATERLTTVISNNLIIDPNPEGRAWNSFVYSSGAYCNQTFYVYNNIFFNNKTTTPISSCWIGQYGALPFLNYGISVHYLNNTIIAKGTPSSVAFTGYNTDTMIVKNNLVVFDTTNSLFYNLDGGDGFPNSHKEIDYNFYAEYGGISASVFGFDNAVSRTYSYWIDLISGFGRDIHSDTTNAINVTFTDKGDTNKVSYYTTSGRDLGVDLSATYPFLTYDAVGNPRSGTWDMGALEYQAGGVDSLPNVFTFTDITSATRSTAYTSNGVTLAGFDSAYAYASGNVYTINGGSDLTGYTRVFPNDVLRLKVTSSGSYSTGVSSTLNVGGRTDTYTVTTESAPIVPSGNGGVAKGSNGVIWRDLTGKIIKVTQ